MNQKVVGIIAIICLLVGIGGIISTLFTIQTMYVLLLALLAIFLFLVNNKDEMDAYYGPTGASTFNILRHFFFFVLGIGFAFYIGVSALSGTATFLVPIFMALLTIGLFFSNRIFKQK